MVVRDDCSLYPGCFIKLGMACTQVVITLQLLRIMSEFIINSAIQGFHVYKSLWMPEIGKEFLPSSEDIQHAWPLCSRHTEGYTDNRACSCWNLQSLLVFPETWGYNQVQSVNRQTPSFAIGARRAHSSMRSDLCCRRSETIEEAQKDCIYTHTLTIIILFALVF